MNGVANANPRNLTYIRICYSDLNSTFFLLRDSIRIQLLLRAARLIVICPAGTSFFKITKQPFFELLLPL